MENLPYEEALALKGSCDLFIDTIGELGYGMSGLEALAMGIPTAVQLLPDHEKILGDHPFINVSEQTLVERLIPFVESRALRRELGEKGKAWVREAHDPLKVVAKIMEKIAGATSS
jgi:glycosyltransferase involved in cell wall biosynthesis